MRGVSKTKPQIEAQEHALLQDQTEIKVLEITLQQPKPPQATTTLSVESHLKFETKLSDNFFLGELICSFDLAGNAHRVHFSSYGVVVSISSSILIAGAKFDITVYYKNNYAIFLPIKKNGNWIELSIDEVKKLKEIISAAILIAEKNYSPEVHEEKEPICPAPTVMKTSSADENIHVIEAKWNRFNAIFRRVLSYLLYANNHHLDMSTFEARFSDLLKQCNDFKSQVNAIVATKKNNNLKLDAMKVEIKKVFDEITEVIKEEGRNIIGFTKNAFILPKIDKLTGELIYHYYQDNLHIEICFNDQGEATAFSSIEIDMTHVLKSTIVFLKHLDRGKTIVRVDINNIIGAQEIKLTPDKHADITKKTKLEFERMKRFYSPVVHEAMQLEQCATTDQKTTISKLSLFLTRIQSYQSYLPAEQEESLKDYINIFLKRFERLESEINAKNKEEIIALRKRYANAYSQAAQPILRVWEEQPTEKQTAKSKKALKKLLKEEEKSKKQTLDTTQKKSDQKPESKKQTPDTTQKKSAQKPESKKQIPDTKSAQKPEPKNPLLPPKVLSKSKEEKFNNDFEGLKKLMGEKLAYFKKHKKTLSAELKKEIDVIEERLKVLKEYYEKHALNENEKVKNKFASLETLWTRIQTVVRDLPKSPPVATAVQQEKTLASTSETETQRKAQDPILPIDDVPHAPSAPPPAATAANQQRFFTHNPYLASVPGYCRNPYADLKNDAESVVTVPAVFLSSRN